MLDKLDLKILYELDHNSRQTSQKIAKKCRTHRNVVNFRINRLIEKGIIRQFVTMISPSALGLTPYKFYFQLQNFTEEKEEQILKLIQLLPVYWAAKVSGRWDFIIGVLVKDAQQLNEIKLKIMSIIGNDVVNRSTSILVEAPHYYRTYLLDKKEVSPIKYWITSSKISPVNELDLKLLKLLATNSRISVLDIAKKTKKNVKTIMNHLKKLEKTNVIYDYRISLNLERINYKFFKCFISLKKASNQRIKQFKEYCRVNKNIIHLIETVGDWDFEPEFEVESQEQFYEILTKIRKEFSDIIHAVETIDIIKEYSYVCLP